MTDSSQFAELRQPLSSAAPCGENLEDSHLLASFDAYRLFGQSVPLNPAPAWRDIESKSRAALEQSKDFRLLAHFGAAVLRTEGLPAFLDTLSVAAHWLNEYWPQVYPLVDDDAILRKNAINSFADRMAIVDGVRRLPILRHAVLGTFTLRDFEIATGQVAKPEGEEVPEESAIRAVLAASPAADLTALQSSVIAALEALKAIETKMREEGGSEAAPTFDPLVTQLVQLQRVLTDGLSGHPGATTEAPVAGNGAAPTTGAAANSGSLGAINSRQDAIRALDAVANYFRTNEPSSPIPLFIERAKRLVAKDFLEVLADIAPDAVSTARSAGGLRDE